ncbi:MAG: hypothetical protein K2H15_06150, partial [Muribaculaceae bacterium]|nr:hypothetical protein [Muribaculaceae bacterium]
MERNTVQSLRRYTIFCFLMRGVSIQRAAIARNINALPLLIDKACFMTISFSSPLCPKMYVTVTVGVSVFIDTA